MKAGRWNKQDVEQLYQMPLFELVTRAFRVHKKYFRNLEMEFCTLLSIKTGKCSEDCAYCAQSSHHSSDIKVTELMDVDSVVEQARLAQKNGAKRFCMGAAWSHPPKTKLCQIIEMIKRIKAMGLETCVTLGTVSAKEALQLKKAGLDFYNHNLNTSPEYYQKIVTTHSFKDRIDTIKNIRRAGLKICCGGIIGMGETRKDRINFLLELALLPMPPDSIPINRFMPAIGTPLVNMPTLDNFEFIKTIAITRILLPKSIIRLAAGRKNMSSEMQAWCFMAGANSIFYGDSLLTAPNPKCDEDLELLNKLGFKLSSTHVYR